MNLEQVQAYLVQRLQGAAALSGVPVLTEDGTYPKTPQREDALRTQGLALIVWQIEPGSVVDSSPTGAAVVEVYVPVIVEENVKVNRAAGGTQIPAEAAVRHVIQAATGRPDPRTAGNKAFELMDPWMRNFGCVGGVQRFVVNLVLPLTLTPILP